MGARWCLQRLESRSRCAARAPAPCSAPLSPAGDADRGNAARRPRPRPASPARRADRHAGDGGGVAARRVRARRARVPVRPPPQPHGTALRASTPVGLAERGWRCPGRQALRTSSARASPPDARGCEQAVAGLASCSRHAHAPQGPAPARQQRPCGRHRPRRDRPPLTSSPGHHRALVVDGYDRFNGARDRVPQLDFLAPGRRGHASGGSRQRRAPWHRGGGAGVRDGPTPTPRRSRRCEARDADGRRRVACSRPGPRAPVGVRRAWRRSARSSGAGTVTCDSRAERVVEYVDRAEGLAAAGLSPD